MKDNFELTEEEKRNNVSNYNHALFENMAFFNDAVWEINADTQTVYFLHDKITYEMNHKLLSFPEIHDFLKNKTHEKISEELIPLFSSSFIKSLKTHFVFSTDFIINNTNHTLNCIMTPLFNKDGSVSIAYLSIRDIQVELDQGNNL